ncbi:MAG TPA: hypothetical protein VFF06_30185 [Polyangia bacterium]|nr:hypothetical protein [Polyangia bacterium]
MNQVGQAFLLASGLAACSDFGIYDESAGLYPYPYPYDDGGVYYPDGGYYPYASPDLALSIPRRRLTAAPFFERLTDFYHRA